MQNKNQELNEFIDKLTEFINGEAIDWEFKIYSDLIDTLKNGKIRKNKNSDIAITDLTIFEPLAKIANTYPRATEYPVKLHFWLFFSNIIAPPHNTKPHSVIFYENFEKAKAIFSQIIDYDLTEYKRREYVRELHSKGLETNPPIYQLSALYERFITFANEYFKEREKCAMEYAKTNTTQGLKNRFNEAMINLCEFYQIEAQTPFKTGNFANAIVKILKIKEN